ARSCSTAGKILPSEQKVAQENADFYNLITKRIFITLSQSHRKAFERKFVYYSNKHPYLYCL
ncbi:hypothetical protein, partial [Photobacterium damselae]|uniref:hypothetical protein n=1 Tax=Photobacterium damselae TaxID=38293 RepID=UPI002F40ADA2